MKNFKFTSQIEIIAQLPEFTQDQIKNEIMFFNSGSSFAKDNAGPITEQFLEIVENYGIRDYVFDSRVHMLMKGWYPAIPGFHHDDVPRSLANGQPNYYNPEYEAEHIMGLANGEICPTQFALGDCTLPDINEDEIYYKKWHPLVDKMCENGILKRIDFPGNAVAKFNSYSFHQAQQANKGGFRWFGRVSWNTERIKHITNEIRRQANVYLEAPMEGW